MDWMSGRRKRKDSQIRKLTGVIFPEKLSQSTAHHFLHQSFYIFLFSPLLKEGISWLGNLVLVFDRVSVPCPSPALLFVTPGRKELLLPLDCVSQATSSQGFWLGLANGKNYRKIKTYEAEREVRIISLPVSLWKHFSSWLRLLQGLSLHEVTSTPGLP